MSRASIFILVTLVGVVWALELGRHGWTVGPDFFQPVPTVVTVLALGWPAWEKWLWKLPPIHPWLVAEPDLSGTWVGTLKSSYVDRNIKAYLAIRQTRSTIAVRMFTRESTSRTIAAKLAEDGGELIIAAVYRNEPELKHQDRSRIHRGAFVLGVHGSPADRLEGFYCTDRETQGEMLSFQRISRRSSSDWISAEALGAKSRTAKS